MDSQLEAIFQRLRETADFAEADFSDVNATSIDGDNALHCVVRWGDLAAVKALINAGIDVNRAGDLELSEASSRLNDTASALMLVGGVSARIAL